MNDQNLKPFQKGPDPRRNLKGVPKDAIAARRLIRRIGAELVALPKDSDGYARELTRFEVMIRAMFSSKAPADRQNLLKALAPGLLKDEIEHTGAGSGPIIIRMVQAKGKDRDDSDGSDDETKD